MEIEAKIAVADRREVEELIGRLGGRRKGEYSETDTFFDYEDRRLKQADSALRLRDRREVQTGTSNYRLTYKGPRQAGPFKNRREIEFAVDQPDKVRAFLEVLGLSIFARYTKRRNSWSLENCDLEADILEGVGHFIEVEGPDEASIRRILGQLNLADQPVIHESYLAMAIRHGLTLPPE